MFAKFKSAVARFFGRTEAEVHDVVAALEDDLAPVAEKFKADVVAASEGAAKTVADAAKVDVEALAAKLSPVLVAEILKALGKTA